MYYIIFLCSIPAVFYFLDHNVKEWTKFENITKQVLIKVLTSFNLEWHRLRVLRIYSGLWSCYFKLWRRTIRSFNNNSIIFLHRKLLFLTFISDGYQRVPLVESISSCEWLQEDVSWFENILIFNVINVINKTLPLCTIKVLHTYWVKIDCQWSNHCSYTKYELCCSSRLSPIP